MRTAKTTATDRTTTCPGITAPRVRPPILRSLRPGRGTCARCWRPCCCRAARRCCRWATSLAGRRHGNNNAYAQDNAGSWVDWPSADGGLIKFTAAVIALRRTLAPLFKGQSLQGRPVDGSLIADVTWLAADGQGINWNRDPGATLIAELFADDVRAVLIFHAPPVPVEIALPVSRPGFGWRRVPGERGGTRGPDDRPTIGDGIPGGGPRSRDRDDHC